MDGWLAAWLACAGVDRFAIDANCMVALRGMLGLLLVSAASLRITAATGVASHGGQSQHRGLSHQHGGQETRNASGMDKPPGAQNGQARLRSAPRAPCWPGLVRDRRGVGGEFPSWTSTSPRRCCSVPDLAACLPQLPTRPRTLPAVYIHTILTILLHLSFSTCF